MTDYNFDWEVCDQANETLLMTDKKLVLQLFIIWSVLR